MNARAAERVNRRRGCVMAIAVIVSLGVRPAAASTCVGDCQATCSVGIADLILGVNIALGLLPVADCGAFANADDRVDIVQLIRGVNSALNGCPCPPLPAPTASAIDTPTPTVALASTPATTPT